MSEQDQDHPRGRALQQIAMGHPRIKRLTNVARNAAPNRDGLFIAEGLWAHNLLLEHDTPIDTFLWCPEAAVGDEARQRAEQLAERAQTAFQISRKTLDRLSERDKPDGLLSLGVLPRWTPEDLQLGESALVMVADGMEIPGNLGTLMRTADACAVDALVLTNRRTRLAHPKVFRASQGMLLTLPVIEFDTPDDAIAWLTAQDFRVFLADTDDAVNYRRADYATGRTAFVLGAERYGIARSWYRPEFERVFIPMLGHADSLNASVSAAVLLFEARAQKERWSSAAPG